MRLIELYRMRSSLLAEEFATQINEGRDVMLSRLNTEPTIIQTEHGPLELRGHIGVGGVHAFLNGQFAGSVDGDGMNTDANHIHIARLKVADRFRGKKFGIGPAMMQHVVGQADAEGIHLTTHVSPSYGYEGTEEEAKARLMGFMGKYGFEQHPDEFEGSMRRAPGATPSSPPPPQSKKSLWRRMTGR